MEDTSLKWTSVQLNNYNKYQILGTILSVITLGLYFLMDYTRYFSRKQHLTYKYIYLYLKEHIRGMNISEEFNHGYGTTEVTVYLPDNSSITYNHKSHWLISSDIRSSSTFSALCFVSRRTRTKLIKVIMDEVKRREKL